MKSDYHRYNHKGKDYDQQNIKDICVWISSILRKRRLLLFIVVVFVFYLHWQSDDDDNVEICPYSINYTDSPSFCVDAVLHAHRVNGGIGNLIFELLSFIGIADTTQRFPVISDRKTLQKLETIMEYFPHLSKYITLGVSKTRCTCFDGVQVIGPNCCSYYGEQIERIGRLDDPTVRIFQRFSQSFKYFEHLPTKVISEVLRGSTKVINQAASGLYQMNEDYTNTTNLCVHIRRGDFVLNGHFLPSEEEFTQAAVLYIAEREPRKPVEVFVMTDDVRWSRDVLYEFNNLHFVKDDSYRAPNAEWEFSRMYCDRVLLTASASAYGWWIAYLSRGQRVFYNYDFSVPFSIEQSVTPADFWPSHWTALRYVNESKTIKIMN